MFVTCTDHHSSVGAQVLQKVAVRNELGDETERLLQGDTAHHGHHVAVMAL